MKNTEVKKLKINTTKIKSTLFKRNRELIKLKKDKIRFFSIQENKKKISKKEVSIEFLPLKVIKNIGQRLLGGPLSLLDKFKEFFGFILLGILVNNLPLIIQKLQDVFSKIKLFLDQNPWIMNVIKWFGTKFGEGIMNLAKVIKDIRPYIGGSFKFALDTIRATKNQIGNIIKTFDELDLSLGGLIKELKVDQIPDVNKDPARYSAFIAGGGKESLDKKGQTVDEVVEQGKKNIGGYDSGSRTPITQKPQTPPKYAKGGTIQPQNNQRNKPIQASKTTSKTPFARPGGTAKGRKARESVKSFNVFNRNVKDQSIDLKEQEKNYNVFEELLKKFKELQELRAKEKPETGGGGGAGGGGGGGGDFIGAAADIPPEGKALLDAIAGAESGGYNARYPSKTFNNGYKDHPRLREPTPDGRTSDAAGRYQFLSRTWDQYKPAKEFTPENQDIAAWRLATAVYGYGESGIVKDLQKDPMKVAAKLRGTWPSLPGGSQTNVHTSGFLSRYNAAVKKYRALTTKPTAGAFRNVLPQGNPQFTSGFRTTDRPGHNGIDIGVDANAPVVALQSGKVSTFYRKFGDHGDAVVVQHSDKTKLIYGHIIPSSGLKVGDNVEKGQVIGKVLEWRNANGYANNTHLHLERVVNGRWVNPIPFINSIESSRIQQLEKSDPRRKLKPGQQGPVLPTQAKQSLMAPTPSVPFGRVFGFTARDGKKYRVEFGKFFEGKFSVIPIDTSETKNKWLIDDYNKAVEQYQSKQQKPKLTPIIEPTLPGRISGEELRRRGIPVSFNPKEPLSLASSQLNSSNRTVVLYQKEVIVT